MSSHLLDQPEMIDLGMSDMEYLALLAQGRDPVREQCDRRELIHYGLSLEAADRVAPLVHQSVQSLEEKVLVVQALQQIWQHLTHQAKERRILGC
ncbi:MAG: hypothetical protein VKJ46_07560 [Leptolyngbyaceae bacterium]|nr:hypothetical protein [Leptolyngbyaceae bacterium]